MKCRVVFAQRIRVEKCYYHYYVITIKGFFQRQTWGGFDCVEIMLLVLIKPVKWHEKPIKALD